jgi:hypothetical protein
MTGWTTLAPGTPVLRWAMAAPEERPYPGTARPMPDRVDYRFANARWTEVPPLPCREALLAELPTRHVARPDGPFPDLVIGLDGGEIDFSRFCFRPTLVARAFRCLIRGAAGPARFRIGTCGGVRLWIGDREAARFEPFTRNLPKWEDVTLDLPADAAPLTLRLEDLHERDTVCFFSLTLLDGRAEVALPPGFDAEAVDAVAATMASLRTDRVFYTSGPVRLIADTPPPGPLALHVPDLAPFSRGGLVADPGAANPAGVTLTPDTPQATLLQAEDAPPGCVSLPIETSVGGARLVRRLGTTILPEGHPLPGDLAARKAGAARLIAAHTGFEPSVAALLALGGVQPDRVARILDPVLRTIEERWDCSDFSILPLLRLWRDARATLSPALADRLRAAVLGYRYWLDEPGDDVMWFWSENHVLCFHAAQLVAGRLFPGETFPNSGKTGERHAGQAADRLDRWFASILEHGLCEWNSAAYYPIDLLGLLTLHDMAPDFRDRAAAVMDRIFVMAALHTSGGTPAGTQGRCYEKELLAGPMTELGSVMAIALGGSFRPGYDRAAALLSLSDYAPPPLDALAAPPPGRALEARYTQGVGHEGKLTVWKSSDGQLATVTDLRTGEHGHQAQVVDVQLARHPMARLWINHPGELKPWGERRPSLLAGNHVLPRVAQAGPVALLIYDLDRPWADIPLTQAFADPAALGPPERAGDWLVFAGTVGLWCSAPLTPVASGLYRGALWRAKGMRTGWAVVLRRPSEATSAFSDRLAASRIAFDAATLTLRAEGLGPDPFALSFDGPLQVGGTPRPFAPLTAEPHLGWDGVPPAPWQDNLAPPETLPRA